ncbi:MAG: hypothetical protein Q3959_06225 [Limosilactobacillus sp.]|uniref:hypothetical protein n=1 Tax=Limosilactobacillus sp. TaxID=2773925 RepID=UPI0026FF03A7|nr:hypothetical protein [Limosilactobacillus sp.]
MTPDRLIKGLEKFVTENHEEELGPYQSLYAEILHQWKAMNCYPMSWAEERSQVIAEKYWEGMNHWYEIFEKSKEEIRKPQLGPKIELATFYMELSEEYATDVKAHLPEVDIDKTVVKINDFPFRLSQQLREFDKLDIEFFTLPDFKMLLEYWHVLAGLVGVDIKE